MPTAFMEEVGRLVALYEKHPPEDPTPDTDESEDYLEFFVQPQPVERSLWLTVEERLGRAADMAKFHGLSLRSCVQGSDIDAVMADGFIMMVPTRGGAHRHPTSLADIKNELIEGCDWYFPEDSFVPAPPPITFRRPTYTQTRWPWARR